MKVFLLHEKTNKETVEAGVKIPVEKAQVVADDIVFIIGELNALALFLAAPLALHAAHENLARNQLKLFELGQELRVQQRFRRRLGHKEDSPQRHKGHKEDKTKSLTIHNAFDSAF